MSLLTFEHITRTYGERVLFRDLALHINPEDKIALIAKNGSGKTSLLRIIAGLESSEGQDALIKLQVGKTMGYLEQSPSFDPSKTILDTLLSGTDKRLNVLRQYEEALAQNDAESINLLSIKMDELHLWSLKSQLEEVMNKLNINLPNKIIGQLSGGQKKRVSLARIIIEDPDLILLDEPTNHLDVEMILWLEGYLSASKRSFLMITHDRYFLERVCNRIVELDEKTLFSYDGNYSQYLEKRAARKRQITTTVTKAQKLMKKELEWINRMPKARTTKNKARVDEFDRIKAKANRKIYTEKMEYHINSTRLGSKIVEFHNVSLQRGDRVIVKNFNYKFKRLERIAIVGPNGIGKSSLLALITGQLPPDTGKMVIGETVQFGYYEQKGLTLKADKRIIDVVRDIGEFLPLKNGKKLTAESLLERFLFPRSQQQVYYSQLSGGEKKRIYLLTILMANPNFLILDEPTNDLDILTINALEEFLLGFEGNVILVSHDRFMVDKLADHLFILDGTGNIRDYNDTFSSFLANPNPAPSSAEATKKKRDEKSDNKQQFELRKKLRNVETQMDKLAKRKAFIEGLFYDQSMEQDEMQKLSKELDEIADKTIQKEEEWMEIAEMLESNQ